LFRVCACSRALLNPLVQIYFKKNLKLFERFLGARSFGDFENVESYGFGKRSALTNRHYVSTLHVPKSRGKMNRDVAMSFLESVVFLDVVEIIPSDDNRPLHLQLRYHPCQNPTSDRHVPREWTLLVYVRSVDCLPRGLKPKTNRLDMPECFFLD